MATLKILEKMNWTKWGVIIAVVPVLLALGSLFCRYHNQFAEAKELYKIRGEMLQVNSNFQYYVLTNQAAKIQQRMWQLEDRHKCKVEGMPQSSKEEYRKLEQDRNKLLEKSKQFENK